MRTRWMFAAALTVSLACTLPAAAQGSSSKPATDPTLEEKKKQVQGVDFDFVDSQEAYWVTRSLNDTIFYPWASPNSVATERNLVRSDEVVKKIVHPSQVGELTVSGGKREAPTPTLKLNGVVVKVEK